MGIPRHSVAKPRTLRPVVAIELCQEVQDADADNSRRARLQGPGGRGPPALHGFTAAEHSLEGSLFSRRGTLGSEASEQRTLVQNRSGLDRPLHQMTPIADCGLSIADLFLMRLVTSNSCHP